MKKKHNPRIEGTLRVERGNLRYLLRAGGQMMTSEFVSGHGRNAKILDLPRFCRQIHKDHAGRYPKRVQELFNQHPRCQYAIAITNMRAAKRLLKLEDEMLDEMNRLEEPLIFGGTDKGERR